MLPCAHEYSWEACIKAELPSWVWHSGFGGLRSNMGNPEEKRPHTCTFCGKSFVKPAHLHEHIQRVHEKVKYPCRTCKKTFASASYRDKHEKKCEGNKYTCRQCGQEFAELVKLNTHRYVQCFKCLNNALTFLFFMPCFCRDFLTIYFKCGNTCTDWAVLWDIFIPLELYHMPWLVDPVSP